MIPPRPMTAREFSVPIVQRFYRESLGDIDLTMMIEQALIEFAAREVEVMRIKFLTVLEERFNIETAEEFDSLIPKASPGRKA